MIVITRRKMGSRHPAMIFHYVLSKDFNKFIKKDKLKTTDPHSATVFHIDDKTYVSVANYKDLSGKYFLFI